jgi:hypothetical protein
MKKHLIVVLTSLILITPIFSAEFHSRLILPFRVDDLEEVASKLGVRGASSNTNLISSVTISQGATPNLKTLTLLSSPNTYGNAQISIVVCDGGYIANNTPLLSITPNSSKSTNSSAPFTLIGSNNAVYLQWTSVSNKYGYKINRFSTGNTTTDKSFTVGTTTQPNFIDTKVVNGNTYWYNVTWIPSDMVPSPSDVLCTNLVFEFRVRPPVELRPNPLGGLWFLSRSNAIYQVFYKTNALQPLWKLQTEIDTLSGQVILLNDNNKFYEKNLIYVREKE